MQHLCLPPPQHTMPLRTCCGYCQGSAISGGICRRWQRTRDNTTTTIHLSRHDMTSRPAHTHPAERRHCMRDEPDPAGTTGSLGQGRNERCLLLLPPFCPSSVPGPKTSTGGGDESTPALPPPRPQTNTPARRWVVTPKGIGDYGSQDERHLPALLSLLLQGPSHQHHMLL